MQYWNAINNLSSLNRGDFLKLTQKFKTMEAAWFANLKALTQAGLPFKKAQEFIEERKIIEPQKLLQNLKRFQIKFTHLKRPDYPPLLTQIADPPPVLYYKGKLPLKSNLIAVIGSRKHSFYGRRVARQLVQELLQKSSSQIISGLAFGIDSIAHRAALEENSPNFAVLGCGLDQVYPASHYQLAKKIIAAGGGLISEYPPGTPLLKHHFFERNRLISGLSLAVLVIEAHKRSGTFITANHALDQNREVFAVPGEIFSSSSKGSHALIQAGAKLVTNAQDIFEELPLFEMKLVKSA